LVNLARGKKNIALIVCDNTRSLPQKEILALTLAELKSAGVEKSAIRIIIATGTHSPMTPQEIRKMLGEEIPASYTVLNHNAFDKNELVFLGRSTEKGIPIYLNKTVAQADLRIGIGTVDPHIFAGYSGGNKILAVGTAGEKSIAQTHNPQMMEDENTKFGDIRNNTFRNFINEVASLVKLDFLVNVVQNSEKELIAAFTGDAIQAYEKAVEVARTLYEVRVERKADIVITMPKVPKTLNLYQAIRSVNSVIFFNEPILHKGGTVILPAECPKGIGSDLFYEELAAAQSPSQYIQEARVRGFPPEANKAFTVAKMLDYCRLIVSDTKIEKRFLEDMFINYASTVTEALESNAREDKKQHVIILTDGFFTLPVLAGQK
jgi:nickel-dependent lactate racemase